MAGIIAVYGLVVSVLIVGNSGYRDVLVLRRSRALTAAFLYSVAPESNYSLYAYVTSAA